jgi:DNA-binding CsgD family transcriptional regulator
MLLARGEWSVAEAAMHLLNGARRGDAAALAGLEQAATEVLDSSPQTAVQLATRALELTRASDPKRAARAVTVAEVLTASGRLGEASQLVDEALAAPPPGLARARLGCVLSCLFYLDGQHARGRMEAEKVLAEPRLPGAVRDNARIALLRALLGLHDNKQAAALARKILAKPRDGQSRAVVAAMIARALILWDEGQVTEALQLSREAAHKHGWSASDARSFQPHLFLATRLVDVHMFDEAARVMRTAADHLEAFPYLGSPAIFAVLRARMHLTNGRPDAAAAELHDSRGNVSGPSDAARSAILGTIALRQGELKAAASYLDGRPAPSPLPEAAYEHSWHALVSAQIQEARAGSRSAVSMLMPVYAALSDHRFLLIHDPTSASWLVRFALAIGDRGRAKLAATVADEVARTNPSFPILAAAAAHARGIAEEDLGLLSFAADRHGDSWGRASAAEDAGVLLAARIERKLAVARLDQALTEYHGCGAARDAARVRRRLRVLGIRRRHWTSARRPLTGWASLTETEQAISQLAAQGLTNQQIAHQMYLSVHTVAFHLRHVFRKLEINSRVELAGLVIGHEQASRQTPPQESQAHRPVWPGRPASLRSTDRSSP